MKGELENLLAFERIGCKADYYYTYLQCGGQGDETHSDLCTTGGACSNGVGAAEDDPAVRQIYAQCMLEEEEARARDERRFTQNLNAGVSNIDYLGHEAEQKRKRLFVLCMEAKGALLKEGCSHTRGAGCYGVPAEEKGFFGSLRD